MLLTERRFPGRHIQSRRVHRRRDAGDLPRVAADAAADAVQVALRVQPARFRPRHSRLLPHPQRCRREPQDFSTVRPPLSTSSSSSFPRPKLQPSQAALTDPFLWKIEILLNHATTEMDKWKIILNNIRLALPTFTTINLTGLLLAFGFIVIAVDT